MFDIPIFLVKVIMVAEDCNAPNIIFLLINLLNPFFLLEQFLLLLFDSLFDS